MMKDVIYMVNMIHIVDKTRVSSCHQTHLVRLFHYFFYIYINIYIYFCIIPILLISAMLNYCKPYWLLYKLCRTNKLSICLQECQVNVLQLKLFTLFLIKSCENLFSLRLNKKCKYIYLHF